MNQDNDRFEELLFTLAAEMGLVLGGDEPALMSCAEKPKDRNDKPLSLLT